ncbi:hypothetical protein BKA65DRAFT_527559 [Rhexocercosporidium sp. MPI-PUGE-AT-0058]|nr:hypothetical protein BKA65DRAFT_527559 [Rhexocercosporidium sp. MPI-PUGE-AT-0058]
MPTTQGPLTASLSHLCGLPLYKKETPYEIWAEDIDPTITKTNVKLEIVHDCVLHDVRLPSTDQPSLETHGFEWAHRPFPTECGIKTANDVGFGDFVRCSKSTHPRTEPNIYSPKGKEGNELRATQIKHVWCPIVDVVESHLLVLCDIRTVEDSDWDVVEKVLDQCVEESMYLKRRQRHQWYWMSDQTKNDSIVMNIWDSFYPDSRRYSAPHCSMVLRDRDIRPNARPRESIELRLLAWKEL